jgi:hypothetical protein
MYKLIKKIGIDRIAHFGIGAFISMLCVITFSWLDIYPTIINGILLSFIIAIYKEAKDKSIGGVFDKWDIIATMIGSLMVLGTFLFTIYII